jgi:activator of HSP90 ATPase
MKMINLITMNDVIFRLYQNLLSAHSVKIYFCQDNPFRRAMRRRDRRSNTSSEDSTSVSSAEGSSTGNPTFVSAENSGDRNTASTRGLCTDLEVIYNRQSSPIKDDFMIDVIGQKESLLVQNIQF